MLTWKCCEQSLGPISFPSTLLLLGPSLWSTSIGPSPAPPVYRPGWPVFWAAWLQARRSVFNSSFSGRFMLRTKNHRLCSKLGTHFRPWNSQVNADTAHRRREALRASRKASLSWVLICSVRDRDTCRGSNAPRSDWSEGMMSGMGSFLTRRAFPASSKSRTCWMRLCRALDSACVGTPLVRQSVVHQVRGAERIG